MTLVKLLAATYDPKQIVWFRIVVHLALVALVFMPRMGFDLFRHPPHRLATREPRHDAAVDLVFFSAVNRSVSPKRSRSARGALAVVILAWPSVG